LSVFFTATHAVHLDFHALKALKFGQPVLIETSSLTLSTSLSKTCGVRRRDIWRTRFSNTGFWRNKQQRKVSFFSQKVSCCSIYKSLLFVRQSPRRQWARGFW